MARGYKYMLEWEESGAVANGIVSGKHSYDATSTEGLTPIPDGRYAPNKVWICFAHVPSRCCEKDT